MNNRKLISYDYVFTLLTLYILFLCFTINSVTCEYGTKPLDLVVCHKAKSYITILHYNAYDNYDSN